MSKNKRTKAVDFKNLHRVIEKGAEEAAREAGLTHFALRVCILDMTVEGHEPAAGIIVEVVQITPEKAKELTTPDTN